MLEIDEIIGKNKKLLEHAANATGKKWQWVTCPKYGNLEVPGLLFVDHAHGVYYYSGWNPLRDSKDAFELQVELGLVVSVNFDYTSVGGWSDVGDTLDVDHINDKHAATRLAIVMAAAEIGKNMQNNCDVSDSAMERARYAMDKVKYSTDKINQINLAAQELPEVAVIVGSSQTKLLK